MRREAGRTWLFFTLFVTSIGALCGSAVAACPGSLTNGTTADATQVMAWLNCKASLDGPQFAGSVGIGTTNPQAVLDLGNATGGTGIAWGGSNGGGRYTNIYSSYSAAGLVLAGGFKGSTSSDIYLSTYGSSIARAGIRLNSFGSAAGSIQFFTDAASTNSIDTTVYPTERMRIDAAGNVGVGTASPSLGRLQIEGSGNQALSIHSTNDDATIRLYYDNVMRWRIYNNPGSGSDLIILDAGQDNGVVLYQNANSWASVSDARLKQNVRTLPVLARLTSYRAVSYDWRSNGQHDIGVIAQELNKSFPELVRRGNSGPRKSYRLDQGGTWSVDYAKLGAVALAGVKELDAKLFSVRTAQQEELIQLRRLVQSQAVELRKMQDRLARLETGKLRTASR